MRCSRSSFGSGMTPIVHETVLAGALDRPASRSLSLLIPAAEQILLATTSPETQSSRYGSNTDRRSSTHRMGRSRNPTKQIASLSPSRGPASAGSQALTNRLRPLQTLNNKVLVLSEKHQELPVSTNLRAWPRDVIFTRRNENARPCKTWHKSCPQRV